MRFKRKATIIRAPEEPGADLRARRKEGGLTIAEVANRVGCSPRYISKVARESRTSVTG